MSASSNGVVDKLRTRGYDLGGAGGAGGATAGLGTKAAGGAGTLNCPLKKATAGVGNGGGKGDGIVNRKHADQDFSRYGVSVTKKPEKLESSTCFQTSSVLRSCSDLMDRFVPGGNTT